MRDLENIKSPFYAHLCCFSLSFFCWTDTVIQGASGTEVTVIVEMRTAWLSLRVTCQGGFFGSGAEAAFSLELNNAAGSNCPSRELNRLAVELVFHRLLRNSASK